MPTLPNSLTLLDITGTSQITSVSVPQNLKALLAGGVPLTAVPSPLPAATLEYAEVCGRPVPPKKLVLPLLIQVVEVFVLGPRLPPVHPLCRALDISDNANIAILPDTLTLLGQLSYVPLTLTKYKYHCVRTARFRRNFLDCPSTTLS